MTNTLLLCTTGFAHNPRHSLRSLPWPGCQARSAAAIEHLRPGRRPAVAIIPGMAEPAGRPLADLAAPAALAAFLRGVERRAAVLAELQSGDPTLGDAALTRAMSAFRPLALEAALVDWPVLFWRQLVSQPALRRASRARPPAIVPVCSPAVRVALLLKLAAGLDDSQAAAVLDVAEGSLRRAIDRALPRHADGSLDIAAWSTLQAGIERRVRELPTARSLRLARIREAALSAPAARFFPPARRPPRSVWAAAALGILALAGTWLYEPMHGNDPIRIVALPAAGEPASRLGREAGLIAHPDFALLADPAGERFAQEVGFLSWMAGHAAAPADADRLPSTEPASVPEDGIPESSDAP